MSEPADIAAIYRRALDVDGVFPYAFGGGFNARFAATRPIDGVGPAGYDCGSFLSMLIHAGAPHEMSYPLSTGGFEKWELEGLGESFAVRVFDGVHNGVIVEHCLGEFRKAPAEHRYVMAHHTNGPHCGFVAEWDFDASFYRARRKRIG